MVKRALLLLFLCPFLLSATQGKAFFLFTVPKSGTFLANKFLHILSGAKPQMVNEQSRDLHNFYQNKFRNGTFNFTHLRDHFNVKGYKALYPNVVPIVQIRDPRDVLVSTVYYYRGILNSKLGEDASFDERLTYSILYKDRQEYYGPLFFFKRALDIIHHLNPLIMRFEDLVGPLGGGNLNAQKDLIRHVANVLNIPLNDDQAYHIGGQLFGNSATFREGQIGSWKSHFTEVHKEQFKNSELENILLELGYEKDHNW